MENWRHVWRDGFLPDIATETLKALHDAVLADDPRLSQGSTTTPPPLMCVSDWPVECGCPIAYCGIIANGGFESTTPESYQNKLKDNPNCCTVGTAEEEFAKLCFQADQRLGEPAACRWFLNWVDETPRNEMRRELLAELKKNLKERGFKYDALLPGDVGPVA